jgi:hypothetical protein
MSKVEKKPSGFFKSERQKEKFVDHLVLPFLGIIAVASVLYTIKSDESPIPYKEVPVVVRAGQGLNNILYDKNRNILGGSIYAQNALTTGESILQAEIQKISPYDAERGIVPAGAVLEVPVFPGLQITKSDNLHLHVDSNHSTSKTSANK